MTANAKSAAYRIRAAIAALGALAAAPIAVAQPQPSPPKVFIETPSPAELLKVYPPQALKEGVDGFAIIGCDIGPEGRLAKCGVETERPMGYGFGQALLSLSTKFRVDTTSEYKPGGRIGVPVKFAAGKS
jgi:hypothetical protein